MNKLLTRLGISVGIIYLLSGCSGITVSQDYEQGYNFSEFKTFAWKSNDSDEYGIKDNELADKRIRTAINNQLAAQSYVLVDSKTPDFLVSYHLTIEQKITSSGVSGGISLGRSSYGRYGGIGMSTGSQVRTYDQGTLLIDITDPQDGKLLWRGISTQSVDKHSDPERSTVIINETVTKMLMQFPPQ